MGYLFRLEEIIETASRIFSSLFSLNENAGVAACIASSSGYFYLSWLFLFCLFFFGYPQLEHPVFVVSFNFIFIHDFLWQRKAALKRLITELPAAVSLAFIAFLELFALF